MSEKSDALAAPVDVTMRRPTLLSVPAMPILAAPLVVRRAQVEEAGALAALLGRAYPTETWDAAGTERELFCDETVKATLVVEAVDSPLAANLWETGKCLEPGPTEAAPIPKLEYTIEFK